MEGRTGGRPEGQVRRMDRQKMRRPQLEGLPTMRRWVRLMVTELCAQDLRETPGMGLWQVWVHCSGGHGCSGHPGRQPRSKARIALHAWCGPRPVTVTVTVTNAFHDWFRPRPITDTRPILHANWGQVLSYFSGLGHKLWVVHHSTRQDWKGSWFGTHNRTFAPCLAAVHRILFR
jgi:hypothetical protein